MKFLEMFTVGQLLPGPNVLNLAVESEGYEVPDIGRVPYIDVAGIFDPQGGSTTLLMLNRDLIKARELEIVWREGAPARGGECQVMTGPDLKAFNSFDAPRRVIPAKVAPPKAGEVRVKVAANGACHSDLHVMTGDMRMPMPVVLGHEGAGIVADSVPVSEQRECEVKAMALFRAAEEAVRFASEAASMLSAVTWSP